MIIQSLCGQNHGIPGRPTRLDRLWTELVRRLRAVARPVLRLPA